jgi:hypothetical protein
MTAAPKGEHTSKEVTAVWVNVLFTQGHFTKHFFSHFILSFIHVKSTAAVLA